MLKRILVFLSLFFAAGQSQALPDDYLVLKPSETGDRESLLILLPGGRISSESYLTLAKTIQDQSEMPLWGEFPSFLPRLRILSKYNPLLITPLT